MKFSSFALTFRPLNGVSDDQVSVLSKWIRKRCEYYHIVTEKQGSERHVHAGIFLKKEMDRSNLAVLLSRLFPDLSASEKSVWLRGIKVMYNNDFIKNYLDKDDDTDIICSSLPEAGHLESFFPPIPAEAVKLPRHSLFYHELEALWLQHIPLGHEINTQTARDFLFDMMYNKRCINVIRDDKQIVQTARHLVRWLKKLSYSTIELAPFEKEE